MNHLSVYTCVLILSVCFRSCTAPPRPPASTNPVFSPFSLLARHLTSLKIASGTKSFLSTHYLTDLSSPVSAHTISLVLALDTTPSTLEPFRLRRYGGTPEALYATIEDVAGVELSDDLVVSRAHCKRAAFVRYASTRRSQIDAAEIGRAHV